MRWPIVLDRVAEAPIIGLGRPRMGQQGKAMGTWKGHTSCGSLGPQQLSSTGVTGSLHPIAVSRAWVGLLASWGFPSSFKIRKLIEPRYSGQ